MPNSGGKMAPISAKHVRQLCICLQCALLAVTIYSLGFFMYRSRVCLVPRTTAPNLESEVLISLVYTAAASGNDSFKGDYVHIGKLTTQNRQQYASLYGYQLSVSTNFRPEDRGFTWSKIKILQDILVPGGPLWVTFADADLLFMEPGIRIEDLIALAPHKDLIISNDAEGLNTGFFVMRNSEWSRDLLRRTWLQHRWFNKLFFEQSAMEELLLANPEDTEQHVEFLETCTINARAHAGWNLWDLYWSGDYVIHFAGSSNILSLFTDYTQTATARMAAVEATAAPGLRAHVSPDKPHASPTPVTSIVLALLCQIALLVLQLWKGGNSCASTPAIKQH